jgi:hypothetical protein
MKKSGREEPMWVVIHTCMETTQEISLYIYNLRLGKMPCFSYYLLYFFLPKSQRTRRWNRFCPEVGGRKEKGR